MQWLCDQARLIGVKNINSYLIEQAGPASQLPDHETCPKHLEPTATRRGQEIEHLPLLIFRSCMNRHWGTDRCPIASYQAKSSQSRSTQESAAATQFSNGECQ